MWEKFVVCYFKWGKKMKSYLVYKRNITANTFLRENHKFFFLFFYYYYLLMTSRKLFNGFSSCYCCVGLGYELFLKLNRVISNKICFSILLNK